MPSPKRDPPMSGSCVKRSHLSVRCMQISSNIMNHFEFEQAKPPSTSMKSLILIHHDHFQPYGHGHMRKDSVSRLDTAWNLYALANLCHKLSCADPFEIVCWCEEYPYPKNPAFKNSFKLSNNIGKDRRSPNKDIRTEDSSNNKNATWKAL
jgi:hypothetical protein